MIAFQEEGHKYSSVSKELKKVKWVSATAFASMFHKEFDQMYHAVKASQNRNSKWFGVSPERMIEIWKAESKRSTDTGSLYHADMEKRYLAMKTMPVLGQDLPVFPPQYDKKGRKISPEQTFQWGVHPEAMMWYKLTDKLGICGQSDTVAITMLDMEDPFSPMVINVSDHKTNKEMKMSSWVDRATGQSEKMFYPFNDMDDCDFSKYTIQLNFYLYIIRKNNPTYVPGTLVLRHVEFEKVGENEWGYPVHQFVDGLPVVSKITKYPVPIIPMEKMEKAINILIEKHG